MTTDNTRQLTPEEQQLARMRQEMDEDDGSMPEFWDPEPGEQLIGELVRYVDAQTKMGPCKVAVVRDIDGDDLVSVWLTRNVLKNEFEKQAPRAGDTVGLKFHGEKASRNGQSSYFLYTLRVVRTKAGDMLANTVSGINTPSTTVVVNDEDLEDVPL